MKTILLLFLLATTTLTAQLTLEITAIPGTTPTGATLYAAGSFNAWQPGEADYQFTEDNGMYTLTIDPSPGTLEFKFTRGSWPTVEGNAAGGFVPNRTFDYDGSATTLSTTIEGWEDQGSGGGGNNSTAADNVQILDTDFFIPQLNRNRRIWLYLPPDYDTSNKNYPVLYMHDGQNLFDAETSFSGEWEVDETLNQLHANGDYGAIVVGIDNGGTHRIDEYSPWFNPSYGGGEGAAYIDFIVETLKPHIDQNFRTLPGRNHTAIIGSSMGGLISQYAVMAHGETFGRGGILSPSFWFSNEVYDQVMQTPKTEDVRYYYLASENEGNGSVVDDIVIMGQQLSAQNYLTNTDYTIVSTADGAHSEWYWAREFADVYEWLFPNASPVPIREVEVPILRIYPNPADSILRVDWTPEPEDELLVFDALGKLVRKVPFNHQMDVSQLNTGVYILELRNRSVLQARSRIIVE